MPERVYYDPFGSRLQGYRLGMQDETGLQEQTRRARVADYDFKNFMPLRLAQAHRTDQYEQAALPYNITNLGLDQRILAANLFSREQPNFGLIGQATGDYAPWLAHAYAYGSGTQPYANGPMLAPLTRNVYDILQQNPAVLQPTYGEQLMKAFGIQGPPTAYQTFGQGLTGTIRPGMDKSVDQYYGFDRAMKVDEAQRLQNAQDWGYQTDQADAQSKAINNMIQMGYMTGKYGGGLPAMNAYGLPSYGAQSTPQDGSVDNTTPDSNNYGGEYFEQ